ncbi:MAG: hypothetical protein IJR82_04230 [Bacilli bacterium]|nr:hypothetical protein [Bacilli bacterium]
MSKREVSDFIGHIETLCQNEKVVNHLLIRINYFSDSIIELTDRELRAIKDDEILDLSIGSGYFTFYSTNWGTTEREKITFFSNSNQVLLAINKDIIYNGEKYMEFFAYQFCNNQLVKANYTVKKDLKNNSGQGRSISLKTQETISLGDGMFLVSDDNDGERRYYQTNIGNFTIDSVSLIFFINMDDNELITEEEYKKRVKVMV